MRWNSSFIKSYLLLHTIGGNVVVFAKFPPIRYTLQMCDRAGQENRCQMRIWTRLCLHFLRESPHIWRQPGPDQTIDTGLRELYFAHALCWDDQDESQPRLELTGSCSLGQCDSAASNYDQYQSDQPHLCHNALLQQILFLKSGDVSSHQSSAEHDQYLGHWPVSLRNKINILKRKSWKMWVWCGVIMACRLRITSTRHPLILSQAN